MDIRRLKMTLFGRKLVVSIKMNDRLLLHVVVQRNSQSMLQGVFLNQNLDLNTTFDYALLVSNFDFWQING